MRSFRLAAASTRRFPGVDAGAKRENGTGLNKQRGNDYAITSIRRRTRWRKCHALRCRSVVSAAGRLLAFDRLGGGGLHGPGLRVFDPDLRRSSRRQTTSPCCRSSTSNRPRPSGWPRRSSAEKDRPRCDVFWNNEILNTLRLKRLGLLEAYQPPIAEEYPAAYRDPRGLLARVRRPGRVLMVNTKLVGEARSPDVDPRSGRSEVARAGGDGQAAVRHHRHARRLPVRRLGRSTRRGVLPKAQTQRGADPLGQQAGGDGRRRRPSRLRPDRHRRRPEPKSRRECPWRSSIPTRSPAGWARCSSPTRWRSSAAVRIPAAARRLVDYLLSPEVEAELAAGPSAQIPLNPNVEPPDRVKTPQTIRAMQGRFRRRRRQVGRRGQVPPRRV